MTSLAINSHPGAPAGGRRMRAASAAFYCCKGGGGRWALRSRAAPRSAALCGPGRGCSALVPIFRALPVSCFLIVELFKRSSDRTSRWSLRNSAAQRAAVCRAGGARPGLRATPSAPCLPCLLPCCSSTESRSQCF